MEIIRVDSVGEWSEEKIWISLGGGNYNEFKFKL